MPAATATQPRMRQVETKVTESQPIPDSVGLGTTWEDFLATAPQDELDITTVKIYRMEPAGSSGYIERLCPAERIDEEWIKQRHGGGVYAIGIRSKNGKSSYERGVRILGEPKIAGAAPAAAATPPASGTDAIAKAMDRQSDLIEKLFDRVAQLQQPSTPQPSATQDSVVKMLSEASTAAIKLVADQAKPAPPPAAEPPKSPIDSLESILAIVDRLKPKEGGLDQELARLKTLKDILMPAGGAQGGSMLEQIKMVSEIVGIFDKMRGDGGGGAVDWKAALVDKLADKLPDVAREVRQIFDARAKETDARARGAAAVAAARAGHAPPAMPGPLPQARPAPAAAAAAAPGVRPHVVPNASTSAGESPAWAGPLDLGGPAEAAAPAAAEISAEAIREAQIVDRYLKQRVVALVAENADPVMLLDMIDGAAPVLAAMLTRATEQQIREFLAGDPQLAEITKLPHFEEYLARLIEVLHEAPEEDLPPRPVN